MSIRALKIIMTFLFGCTFGILMVVLAANDYQVIAALCGVLSTILLIATGVLLEAEL